MKGKHIALFGAAAALIGGCSSGSSYKPTPIKEVEVAKVAPGQEMTLWPVDVGNTWTYDVSTTQQTAANQGTSNSVVTFKVKSVKEFGKKKQATIETTSESGETKMNQVWEIGPDQIAQVWIEKSSRLFAPPQPAALFPIKPGEEVRFKGKGPTLVGPIGDFDLKIKCLGPTFVDTAKGRMSAFAWEATGSFSGTDNSGKPIKGITESTSYFVPNVGLVRFNQRAVLQDSKGAQLTAIQTIRLKNEVIGNAAKQ